MLNCFCGSAFQSINEWTTENVLEWLAAVNMYDHVEVFKTKAIKGCDLPNLDRDKLEVSRKGHTLLVGDTNKVVNCASFLTSKWVLRMNSISKQS